MNFRRAVFFIGIAIIALLAGCSNPNPILFTLPPIGPQPTSILFVIAPPTSLAINASVTLSAAVTSNASTALINWSATCGSGGACGSFSATQTGSGGNTTYTAPSAIPSGTTVTVTATVVGDSTKSISAPITITPPQPITVTFFGVPPASLQVNATAALHAQITNDVSANPEVTWSVTCASSACGSFNPTTTSSEAATNYTAPSTIPSGNTVTVTATSVTDPTKSVSANITITAAAETLANGTYVFHLSGPVGSGANFVAGVFVAEGGLITGGEQDFVSYSVDQNAGQNLYLEDPIMGGSLTTTPDGNLQITVKTNDFNVGNVGTEIFNGVIVSASRALLTEVNSAIGTGTLDLQTSPIVAPTAGYAFTVSGVDLNGVPAGIGGVLNIDSPGGISGNGSVIDVNDNFMFTGAQSVGTSRVVGPDSFGRVVFQLSPGTGATFESLNLAGYIVDAEHIRLVETGGDNFQGIVGGTALSQVGTGTFTSTSIANSSYVFGAAGEDQSGPLQVAGVLIADSSNDITGTLNWNDLTTKANQSPIAFTTGSYAVDPTGRVTLSNLTDGVTFNYQLELYLTGSGQGLLLSSSATSTTTQMIAGRGLQQQTGALSFSGTYAMNAEPSGALGPITSVAGASSDSLTGFVDFGSGATDFPVSGTIIAAANGILSGPVAGLDSAAYSAADNFAFYLASDSEAVMIETDNAQLTLGFLELQ